MIKNLLILIILFYVLAALEASFLSFFNPLGFTSYLILIAVAFISFFEKPQGSLGLSAAAIGGFWQDIFSASPIGFHVIIYISAALFIKYVVRKYVGYSVFRRI